jgi:hypothetical protein
VREALDDVLELAGVTDTYSFTRVKICNEYETTQQVVLAAPLIGDDAAIRHLPWLSPDEIDQILAERDAAGYDMTHGGGDGGDDDEA